jgi:hypothetical protein
VLDQIDTTYCKLIPSVLEVGIFTDNELSYSDTTKKVLIGAAFIHLKCGNKVAKFACDLPTVSPRMLLSGPAGSPSLICFMIYIFASFCMFIVISSCSCEILL